MNNFYEPAEDSFLMSDYLKKILPKMVEEKPNLKFLEIGSGSGIQLKVALESGIKKENILGSDINNKAVENCKNLGFNCVESNLFEEIPKEKFDLIVFNPPYLPLDEKEPEDSRIATTGGIKGNEISIEFLNGAKDYLSSNGFILLIASSLSEKIDFDSLGFEKELVSEKNLFSENLYLLSLTLKKVYKE